MAKVIDELLISVGFDADKAGVDDVESSFDSIVSSAKGVGVALAGAFSLDAIFGKMNQLAGVWDGLAKTTRAYDIDPNLLQNLDYISESLGGAQGEAFALINSLRDIKVNIKTGNLGPLEDIIKQGGPNLIGLFQGARSDEELITGLVSRLNGMSKAQQQATMDALGLQTGMRNLVKEGVDGYREMSEKSQGYLGNITESSTRAAEEYQQAWTDANKAVEASFQNLFAAQMEKITKFLNTVTELVTMYRDLEKTISGGYDDAREAVVGGSETREMVVKNFEENTYPVAIAKSQFELYKKAYDWLTSSGGSVPSSANTEGGIPYSGGIQQPSYPTMYGGSASGKTSQKNTVEQNVVINISTTGDAKQTASELNKQLNVMSQQASNNLQVNSQ